MALKDDVTGSERSYSMAQLMTYGTFLVLIGGALGGLMGNAITAGEYKAKIEATERAVREVHDETVTMREHVARDDQRDIELTKRLERIENLLIQLKNGHQ